MGRAKIDTGKKIDDKKKRLVTLAKRRDGIFKKAKELAALCDCFVVASVYSTDKRELYKFSSHGTWGNAQKEMASFSERNERTKIETEKLQQVELQQAELQLQLDLAINAVEEQKAKLKQINNPQ
jgi:MADS-box transcription factor